MLVDLVSWFCEPQLRGEALAGRPAEEGLEGQESRGTRRVRGLKWQVPREFMRCGRQLFKPQTVLLRSWRQIALAIAQTLGTGVVLGEPGFDLGERGRRDPPAAEARRGESLFSRRGSYAKN